MKQSFRMKLRQFWIPKDFRLPEPEFTKEQLDLLEELIQMIGPNISRSAGATKDDRAKMIDFVIDLGTGMWRVRRKIDGLSRLPREIKDALYSIESMWVSMAEDGVEIMDHIGAMPSPREAKVIEIREIPGLSREQVVDAIKPTIMLKGEIVQLGEVIVGRPLYSGISGVKPPQPSDISAETPAAVPAASLANDPAYSQASGSGNAAGPDDEIPVPAREVETLTMTPPLRKWNPESEYASENVNAMSEITNNPAPLVSSSKAENDSIQEIQIVTPEPGETILDSEPAAIAEAQGTENTAPVESGAGTSVPESEAQIPDTPEAPIIPPKKRRRKTSAAEENNLSDAEKPAGRKTARTSAPRKSKRAVDAAFDETNVPPEDGA